jgi:DNA-binding transcriptional LysR family regulator
MIRWRFRKDEQSVTVEPKGPLIVEDMDTAIQAALEGVGVAATLEAVVAPYVASGALVRVLQDWCSAVPGYFLYYPSRRQQPAALSALIDTLRV